MLTIIYSINLKLIEMSSTNNTQYFNVQKISLSSGSFLTNILASNPTNTTEMQLPPNSGTAGQYLSTNGGAETNWKDLNFTAGPTGPPGQNGVEGPIGEQGPQGVTGPSGSGVLPVTTLLYGIVNLSSTLTLTNANVEYIVQPLTLTNGSGITIVGNNRVQVSSNRKYLVSSTIMGTTDELGVLLRVYKVNTAGTIATLLGEIMEGTSDFTGVTSVSISIAVTLQASESIRITAERYGNSANNDFTKAIITINSLTV
jgi:hypothetical protein